MDRYFKLLFAGLIAVMLTTACGHDDDDDDAAGAPQFQATQTFNVNLSGAEEVPMTGSDATATAVLELDENLSQFRASLDISGVANVTAAHIHQGSIGVNGDPAFTFEDDGGGSMSIAITDLTSELIDELQAGGWYINVHTDAYPPGEVRGQIVDDNTAIVTFVLSGAQEVPALDTDASGHGYATLNTSSYAVDLKIHTSGVDDATAAHIHEGFVGENGDVVVALEQSMDDLAMWMTPAGAALDEPTAMRLVSGGHYVNVHTPANPPGEIRGQILTDDFALVTFSLSGNQEVPAVDTAASGDGYATLNTSTYEVDLKVLTSGTDDATGAHIHEGFVGENGDVVVALVQNMDNTAMWMTPEGAALDEATAMRLVSGGHYVNVHTPANPPGEIRGQILTDEFALLTFALSGDQEVPALDSAASGDGYATLNTSSYAVDLKVVTSGADDATAAHIHEGFVGENGDVVVALEQDSNDLGTWKTPAGAMLDEATAMRLVSGGHYVNVHTPANPPGEIRGQILTDEFALVTFKLDGEQSVPGVDTMASGDGYATLNTGSYAVDLKVVTSGVDDATAAHIHEGFVGENGGVVVALEQSMDAAGTWMTPAGAMLDEATAMRLVSGGHYVNVHTPAYPSGEIRGQILTDNFVLVTFPLSGDQEVPPVVTAAEGFGYATLNQSDLSLLLRIVTTGVDDATAAHIHEGAMGVNGGVVVALEQDMGDPGIWMTPDGAMLDQATADLLLSGGHYVNVHTPANPPGEIRGQIE